MRTRMLFVSLSLILLSVAVLSFTTARPWVRLGSKTVDRMIDHDVIDVGYRDGTFQQLRIMVTNGSLNMRQCVVHFENGEEQNVPLRFNFARGGASRVIDLAGNKRFIDRISFWYDTKARSNGKAEVTVWGR